MNRRILLTGLGALLAAPAIVRASSLMPVKAWVEEPTRFKCYEHYNRGLFGSIQMQMTTDFGDRIVLHVGASEPILAGDYVVIRDGYARPMTLHDIREAEANPHDYQRSGVAIRSSDIPRTQSKWYPSNQT